MDSERANQAAPEDEAAASPETVFGMADEEIQRFGARLAKSAAALIVVGWCYLLIAHRGEYVEPEPFLGPVTHWLQPAHSDAWYHANVVTVCLILLAVLGRRSGRFWRRVGLGVTLYLGYVFVFDQAGLKFLVFAPLFLLGAPLLGLYSAVLWSPALFAFAYLPPLTKAEFFARRPSRMLPPMALISLLGFLLIPWGSRLPAYPAANTPSSSASWSTHQHRRDDLRLAEDRRQHREDEKRKLGRALANFDGLIQAIGSYEADHGAPPVDLELLVPDYVASLDRDDVPAVPFWHYVLGQAPGPGWFLEMRVCPYLGPSCMLFVPGKFGDELEFANGYLESSTFSHQASPAEGQPVLGTWYGSYQDFPTSKRH